MKVTLRVCGAVTAVAGALVLASCSPGDLLDSAVESAVEKGIESATGSEIDVDEDGGNLSIKTEDGEVSFGGGAELPDGFPEADVPLIDGEIISAMRIQNETSDGFGINMTVQGTIADVHDEAAGLLQGAGFTETTVSDLGEMRSSGYEGSGDVAGVVLTSMADTDEGTVVVGYVVTMKVAE